jgi:pimeloyl-ACP methyl ester carboxylesterase
VAQHLNYAVHGGDGPALLLVHGGQYGSWYAVDSWDTVLAPLAERFRVVALDRPRRLRRARGTLCPRSAGLGGLPLLRVRN